MKTNSAVFLGDMTASTITIAINPTIWITPKGKKLLLVKDTFMREANKDCTRNNIDVRQDAISPYIQSHPIEKDKPIEQHALPPLGDIGIWVVDYYKGLEL